MLAGLQILQVQVKLLALGIRDAVGRFHRLPWARIDGIFAFAQRTGRVVCRDSYVDGIAFVNGSFSRNMGGVLSIITGVLTNSACWAYRMSFEGRSEARTRK